MKNSILFYIVSAQCFFPYCALAHLKIPGINIDTHIYRPVPNDFENDKALVVFQTENLREMLSKVYYNQFTLEFLVSELIDKYGVGKSMTMGDIVRSSNEILTSRIEIMNAPNFPLKIIVRSLETSPPTFYISYPLPFAEEIDSDIKETVSYEELIDNISNSISSSSFYSLVLENFDEGDAIAFVTSVRIHDITVNPQRARKIKGVNNSRIADGHPNISKRKDGKWVAQMPLDVNTKQRRTLMIVSSTKEKLIALLQAVARFFARNPELLSMPLDKMVKKMKKELPNGEGITIKDEEFNKFYIVDLNNILLNRKKDT